jgi:hypothetical protein
LSAALTMLAQIAPEFGGTCVQSCDRCTLNLPIRLVDGREIPYALELRDSRGVVSVREKAPKHLPAFCPERHINSDGTFCLNYSPVQSLKIDDEGTARAWLETVYQFLKLQERARSQRKWPNSNAWAHGGAARHQFRAQRAAGVLGNKIASAQSSNQLTVRCRQSKGRAVLELLHSGKCLYRVWEAKRKVTNQRKGCFCGRSGARRPKALRKCSDHGEQAVELVFALYEWRRDEKRFWDSMRDRACCESCDNCPLTTTT